MAFWRAPRQNTDGENVLVHELGKNGQIQFFGPACNFSVGILSICVLSWSLLEINPNPRKNKNNNNCYKCRNAS